MLASSCFPAELETELGIKPAYRARQIFTALYSGAQTFNDITALPQELRNRLQEGGPLFSSRVIQNLTENETNAKLGIELHDKLRIECVMLQDRQQRKTACLSSQAGCAMGCAFCKTGSLGLKRNLEAGEIIEQFLHLQRAFGAIDNIVFMGMGEPMANFKAVLKSVDLLGAKEGLALSPRRFTVSTCGIIKGIEELAGSRSQIRLAVSLVTADQSLREKLMPSAKNNKLQPLKAALQKYQAAGGKRITLEAALLPEVNDRPLDAQLIAQFAAGLDCMVNLIPWNPVPGLPFRPPKEEEVQRFIALLKSQGVNTVRRYKRAASIGGACGQLG